MADDAGEGLAEKEEEEEDEDVGQVVIRGISRVGEFRVATPTDIRACLAKQRVNMGPLPRQNDPFNKGAFDCGLTSAQRAWILSYCGKFASCRECEKDAGGCVHFPLPELMDDE